MEMKLMDLKKTPFILRYYIKVVKKRCFNFFWLS